MDEGGIEGEDAGLRQRLLEGLQHKRRQRVDDVRKEYMAENPEHRGGLERIMQLEAQEREAGGAIRMPPRGGTTEVSRLIINAAERGTRCTIDHAWRPSVDMSSGASGPGDGAAVMQGDAEQRPQSEEEDAEESEEPRGPRLETNKAEDRQSGQDDDSDMMIEWEDDDDPRESSRAIEVQDGDDPLHDGDDEYQERDAEQLQGSQRDVHALRASSSSAPVDETERDDSEWFPSGVPEHVIAREVERRALDAAKRQADLDAMTHSRGVNRGLVDCGGNLSLVFSYFDGLRALEIPLTVRMARNSTVQEAVALAEQLVNSYCTDCPIPSGERLLLVKHWSILPPHVTFKHLIDSRAEGKNGPLHGCWGEAEHMGRISPDEWERREASPSRVARLVRTEWVLANARIPPMSMWEYWDPAVDWAGQRREIRELLHEMHPGHDDDVMPQMRDYTLPTAVIPDKGVRWLIRVPEDKIAQLWAEAEKDPSLCLLTMKPGEFDAKKHERELKRASKTRRSPAYLNQPGFALQQSAFPVRSKTSHRDRMG